MHYLYSKEIIDGQTHYAHIGGIKLYGYRGGIIHTQLTRQAAHAPLSTPCGWQLDLPAYFRELAKTVQPTRPGAELVMLVDLKPGVAGYSSLYELTNIWGFSYEDWSPVMLELRGIFIDQPCVRGGAAIPKDEFQREFAVAGYRDGSRILTFGYAKDGGITDGKPTGKWTLPPPASMNGALLWPDAVEYFKRFM